MFEVFQLIEVGVDIADLQFKILVVLLQFFYFCLLGLEDGLQIKQFGLDADELILLSVQLFVLFVQFKLHLFE